MTETSELTLMAVHAHPDDEASSTGGILARYAHEGIRTVLVVCTNGELGDGPHGVKPGSPGHDEEAVVEIRRAELAASCKILGISDLEMLGYHDSGMMGWESNKSPQAFWNVPVERGARSLAALIRRYKPQVVVTYDANGFYGHPDHIQAHRITLAALEDTEGADKLYFPAIPKSALSQFANTLREAGIEMPTPDGEDFDFGTDDDLITTVVDCSDYVGAKFNALAAHASQTDSSFFMQLGPERFATLFNYESFVRHFDRSGAALPESDLFAGLR